MWTSRLRVARRAALGSEGGMAPTHASEGTSRQTELTSPGSQPSDPAGVELVPPLRYGTVEAELASPESRPSDPAGADAQSELVPPLRYGTVEKRSTRTVVVETLREASTEVPPPRALVVRPPAGYVEAALGIALGAAAIAGIVWAVVGAVRSGQIDDDWGPLVGVLLMLLGGGPVVFGFIDMLIEDGWGKGLRADQEGIRVPKRIRWSTLRRIDIVKSRDGNGNARMVLVTGRRKRRVHCDQLRGYREAQLHQIAQQLLAMRTLYTAPPPTVYTPSPTPDTPSPQVGEPRGRDGHETDDEETPSVTSAPSWQEVSGNWPK
jgi:hypothetical protein